MPYVVFLLMLFLLNEKKIVDNEIETLQRVFFVLKNLTNKNFFLTPRPKLSFTELCYKSQTSPWNTNNMRTLLMI